MFGMNTSAIDTISKISDALWGAISGIQSLLTEMQKHSKDIFDIVKTNSDNINKLIGCQTSQVTINDALIKRVIELENNQTSFVNMINNLQSILVEHKLAVVDEKKDALH